MERRHSHRPAGVRTMSLVALGAATFTIVSAYGFSSGDPGRIAANVASGVGFLGAGTITHPKRYIKGSSDIDSDVRGLTTAAAIWITAGLGMAAGAGMFFTAIAGTVITITVLKMSNLKSVMFRRVSRKTVCRLCSRWFTRSASVQLEYCTDCGLYTMPRAGKGYGVSQLHDKRNELVASSGRAASLQ
ncbi:MgtC family-domain-containing protein [Tribonema minus]|uniref:MgtC family-domain-containing protein n=1 Tax=Tribonema minus TaxID=303371 RepID=A0A835YXE4_9STRA|nr:MgtC family-domain-containing protein [Tribonema minus]